ncbi:MAG TPA: DNA (cytosine-5-)-methyltransferase [Steroidobacteraceae bacterium]|nr:DNA (cytosine-5-)-methyltransferase [Steroidobacteraceae bacterium]
MPLVETNQALEALRVARTRLSRDELASELGISARSIERWENGAIKNPRLVWRALNDLLRAQLVRVEPAAHGDFTFADLFAGIGGTRLGFEHAGGRCVFTSEYDRFCVQTYRANFRPEHEVAGDIREITASDELIAARIPDHDVLVAGFPCQPFSIAGVSKKNALGRAHGFECDTQGTLFFDICKILQVKRPLAFLLENVRNLRSHDGGKTFTVIMESLKELGYQVDTRVIDARHWVPQHRERVYIAGFLEPTAFRIQDIALPSGKPRTLSSVLHPENGSEGVHAGFTTAPSGSVDRRYTLTTHLWNYLKRYKEKHAAAGNGFGFGLVTGKDVARTLSARYYKDGSEILVSRGPRSNPRRLTPRECARLMGFPDSFRIQVSDTQAYKQFGNSVVVPVIQTIAAAMKPHVITLKAQAAGNQLAMVV